MAAHVLSQVNDGEAARCCWVSVCILTGEVNDLLWGQSSSVNVLSRQEPLLWWPCSPQSKREKGTGLEKQGQRPFCLCKGACGPEFRDQLSLSPNQAFLPHSPQGSCPHADLAACSAPSHNREMPVLLACPGRAMEAQGALLYPGTGRNRSSGRKQSYLLICGPEALGTPPRPRWVMQRPGGSRNRQPCLHQQQLRHCTSQAFGTPRRDQSLFALGKKNPRLADNLNPLFSPCSDLLPSPRRWQSPAGSGTQEELRRAAGAGLRTRDSGAGPGTDRSLVRAGPRAGTAAARPHRPRTRRGSGTGDTAGPDPAGSPALQRRTLLGVQRGHRHTLWQALGAF